jgi:hypothetical protein
MESYQQFIKRKDKEFRKRKLIKVKDIGRRARHFWQREAWTFMPQYDLKEKVFIIERLRRIKTEGKAARPKTARIGDVEYRLGYYIIGKNGRAKGKWVWGQFCPFIPRRDFKKLIKKAQKEGTIK